MISPDETSQISEINAELKRLNERMRLSLPKLLGVQFLRGMAFGLGSFLGATLVVSALIYSLSSINFIPIIGDWASQIAERIQTR